MFFVHIYEQKVDLSVKNQNMFENTNARSNFNIFFIFD